MGGMVQETMLSKKILHNKAVQGQCVLQQNIFSIIHQALKFNSHLTSLSRLNSKSGGCPFKATSTSYGFAAQRLCF